MKISSGKLNTAPKCPRCRAVLDGWTEMEPGEGPRPGDVTVCVYCSTVLQYTKNFGLKRASAETIAKFTLELSRAQRVLKEKRENTNTRKGDGGRGEN